MGLQVWQFINIADNNVEFFPFFLCSQPKWKWAPKNEKLLGKCWQKAHGPSKNSWEQAHFPYFLPSLLSFFLSFFHLDFSLIENKKKEKREKDIYVYKKKKSQQRATAAAALINIIEKSIVLPRSLSAVTWAAPIENGPTTEKDTHTRWKGSSYNFQAFGKRRANDGKPNGGKRL